MKTMTGVLVAGSAAMALVLSACGGSSSTTPSTNSSGGGSTGFDGGVHGIVHVSDKKGGTLHMAYSSDVDSLDSTRVYYASGQNFMRSFYNRTLVTPASAPGAEGLVLKPDLASAMPTISSDGKTYTFKLRSGLKFEDGSPITSKDVKYAVERTFAQDVLSGGPTYLVQQLDQGQKYPGPYKDSDPNKLGLKSVETPDDSTIIFHLAAPFSDFLNLLVMAAGAVPKDKDTGERYTDHVISDGPYMFDQVDPGKAITMKRNPNWDPATDPNRRALPDRIELRLQVPPDEIDKELLDGTLDLDFGQAGVQQAAQAKILLDPSLKANTDDPVTGFIRYFTISSVVKPFDNIHCRNAVQYAADKTALQTARGGPVAGGDIATNMLPPTINGYDQNLDPFNTRSGKPQIEKAKDELKQCGYPNGFNTVLATRNVGKDPKTAEALQQSLAAVGIKATLDQSDASLYFRSTIGSPANVHEKGYGIMLASWGADFPSPYGFLDVLVDGKAIQASGNNNYAELNDPDINQLIVQARGQTDPDKAAGIWKTINQKVMATGTQLPAVYDKSLNYRNPRLTNVYVYRYFGQWDFASLGLSDGK